jgi:hypothetical protein
VKPTLPKCREWRISGSDQVLCSLAEAETSKDRCNSTSATTSLSIITKSQYQSFRLFHHFPALQELKFSYCHHLTSLPPESIKQLSSLESLELFWCQSISALPEWLSDVSSLKKLVIKHCHSIKSLPACMQQLTNLQLLVIDRDNKELKQWCESEDNKAKLGHINIVSSRLNGIYCPKSSIQAIS